MFEFIRGALAAASTTCAVVETNGVGYKIFLPPNTYPRLPQKGHALLLYVSFVVRENLQNLYGFLAAEERDLFELLLTISGVGPKTALGITGSLSLADLHNAILRNDLRSLTKVPGVGKKTAERLIMEIRDKIGALAPALSREPLPAGPKGLWQDALAALANLGFNHVTAQKALQEALAEAEGEVDLSTLVSMALRRA